MKLKLPKISPMLDNKIIMNKSKSSTILTINEDLNYRKYYNNILYYNNQNTYIIKNNINNENSIILN